MVAAVAVLAIAAVVVGVVAGGKSGDSQKVTNAGGGGGDEETSEFALRAGAICAQSLRKRGKVVAPTSPRGIAQLSTALLPVYEYRLRKLRALAPLAPRPKIFQAWLGQLREARAHLIAARQSGLRGDRKNADFELRLFSGTQATSEFLAEQLRVEGCAEQE